MQLVHFTARGAASGLESDMRALDRAPAVVSGEAWLAASRSGAQAEAAVLLLPAEDYPAQRVCSALDRSEAPTLAVFSRNGGRVNREVAVRCRDFLHWPCARDELGIRLQRLLPSGDGSSSAAGEASELSEEFAAYDLIGKSAPFVAALGLIKKAARCEAPVLLGGETGTGKDVAARAVHYLSERASGPFVPLNCGAVPDSLIENELFGHERGAFTDAREARPGVVALADGGSLFLDEVDALSHKAQVALLRFLQDRQYRPLGARSARVADVRVIAATNSDLGRLVEEGRFRQDLFYRLNIIWLRLPPLRERGADVELLAQHFLGALRERYTRPGKHLDAQAMRVLRAHDWPGNVRELENVLHQAFVLSDGDALQVKALGSAAKSASATVPPAEQFPFSGTLGDAKASLVAAFERRYLAQLLSETGGNVSEAARRAGKERRALGKLLKKYGLSRSP